MSDYNNSIRLLFYIIDFFEFKLIIIKNNKLSRIKINDLFKIYYQKFRIN